MGIERRKPSSDAVQREKEDHSYIQRIAALTGLDPTEITKEQVAQFYRSTSPVYEQYLRRYLFKSRLRMERSHELRLLAEGLLDVRSQYISYGSYSLTYRTALRIQQSTEGADVKKQHHALLMGALGPPTITEFSQTVRAVHPDARCLVMDIKGADTAMIDPNIAQFVYANAFNIPVRPNTVDSIHTNALTPFLYGKPLTTFFSEAYNALSQNGYLIMVETKYDLEAQLQQVGFSDIFSSNAPKFATRRTMDRFFAGNQNGLVAENDLVPSEQARVIVATKQKQGTYQKSLKDIPIFRQG